MSHEILSTSILCPVPGVSASTQPASARLSSRLAVQFVAEVIRMTSRVNLSNLDHSRIGLSTDS